MKVYLAITQLLDQHNIKYEVKAHAPTPTSEDSAQARNEPLKIGAKAIVAKADSGFIMLVLPGDRKIDSKAVKELLKARDFRFATREELASLTSLEPGAVPPFGNLFNLPTLMDKAFLEEEFIAFNAGELTKSIKMKVKDYRALAAPRVEEFSYKK